MHQDEYDPILIPSLVFRGFNRLKSKHFFLLTKTFKCSEMLLFFDRECSHLLQNQPSGILFFYYVNEFQLRKWMFLLCFVIFDTNGGNVWI